MQIRSIHLGMLVTLAAGCVTHAAHPVAQQDCTRAPASSIPSELDARALAGQYTVSLHLEGHEGVQRHEWRLWLWPTSAADSSPRTGKRAARADTLNTPLYGTLVRGTARSLMSDAAVRAGVDPVYPPLLLHDVGRRTQHRSLLMMVGAEGNSRDGVMVYDGGGSALWIRSADSGAFRGSVLPAGLVMTDTGYFCATRVRP